MELNGILGRVRDGFFREFGCGKPLRIQLDQKQQLAPSRLIRSAQRAHELVVYDLLAAIYDSRAARTSRSGREAQIVTAVPPSRRP